MSIREKITYRWGRLRWWGRRQHGAFHAWRVCRQTYRWFKEDPKRWARGSYFDVMSYSGEGDLTTEEMTLRSQARNLIDDETGQRYASPNARMWAHVLEMQTRNWLAACAMGGFQKFAWEVMRKPDMGKEKHRFFVDLVADLAGLRLVRVKGNEQWASLPINHPTDLKDVHSRVTAINDHSSWKEMEPRFKAAAQIYVLLRFRTWVRRLFERPEEEAPDA